MNVPETLLLYTHYALTEMNWSNLPDPLVWEILGRNKYDELVKFGWEESRMLLRNLLFLNRHWHAVIKRAICKNCLEAWSWRFNHRKSKIVFCMNCRWILRTENEKMKEQT